MGKRPNESSVINEAARSGLNAAVPELYGPHGTRFPFGHPGEGMGAGCWDQHQPQREAGTRLRGGESSPVCKLSHPEREFVHPSLPPLI